MAIHISVQKTSHSRLNDVDFGDIPFGRVYSDHMFIADYKDGQWGDYRIEPYANLSISPANAAIHYGQSIFEGLKAYRSEEDKVLVFRPKDNLVRMNASAERLCIPQIPEEVYMEGLNQLLAIDAGWVPNKPDTSLYIRPVVFAMDEYIGIRASDNYTFIIFTCPVGAYYAEPVKVKIETDYTRAVKGGIGYAKAAGNYASALYPAIKAQKDGYDQLIWTDGVSHQYIEEAGTMNIMCIINNTLLTAPTGDSILKGITRDSVLTLAKEWGLKVEERSISVEELVKALKNNEVQEAFGTGTAATIAQIKAIGYQGVDYELPPVEGREFSNKVLKTLDNIKKGNANDAYGWVHTIS